LDVSLSIIWLSLAWNENQEIHACVDAVNELTTSAFFWGENIEKIKVVPPNKVIVP
jgi:hypothetical protein